MTGTTRAAFYALRPGGWRDYVTLLHPPYTLWHLSYVAIGAALAPQIKWGLLGWTVLAFLLAMGVGAHALDELNGRPLGTHIPRGVLIALAGLSLGAAAVIGIAVAADTTYWLLAFVVAGAFLVVAYNLELFGGTFHTDFWFAFAWGAFPVLTAYFASAERLHSAAVAAAAFAALASAAQRTLSTEVRRARRSLGAPAAARTAESALVLLSVGFPLLAGSLLLFRLA